jgi:hypothetical protein
MSGDLKVQSLVKLTDISEHPAAVSILTVVLSRSDNGEISLIRKYKIYA